MNIIIAGDGEVGFYLAKSLTELDYNITVVDPHSALLKRLESVADLLTITGDSTSPDVLKEARIGSCDLFLAVLHDETKNLISSMVAKHLGARRTVARVSNPEYLNNKNRDMFRELGVDEMVCPERIAVKEISNLIENPFATEFFDFSGGLLTMYMVRLREGSSLIGKNLVEFRARQEVTHARIMAVLRKGETHIPRGNFIFERDDLCYVLAKPHQVDQLYKLLGINPVGSRIRSVSIIGGGRVGSLAAQTLSGKMQVTLVDQDIDCCRELTTRLKDVTIICGDATDMDLMEDEGLWDTDALVSVTNYTETNVLSCLHARRKGVGRTIALVENTGFINLSQDIGIDTIINKKLITASYIARFIVRGSAVSSKWLSGTNAELIEFEVKRLSPATRVPMGKLNLPEGGTIGGFVRNNKAFLADHDAQLKKDDKVIVFALPQAMDKMSRLFNI